MQSRSNVMHLRYYSNIVGKAMGFSTTYSQGRKHTICSTNIPKVREHNICFAIPSKQSQSKKVDLNIVKVSKGAKIRNRYYQVPHLTQDANGKVTNSQLDTTNESQEVSPFPAGDHKHIQTDTHKDIANTRQKIPIKEPQKKYRLGTVSKIFYWRA